MPCTYTGSLDGDTIMMQRQALDRRERMLCALVGELIEEGLDHRVILRAAGARADGLETNDILNWWIAHRQAEGA